MGERGKKPSVSATKSQDELELLFTTPMLELSHNVIWKCEISVNSFINH